MCREEGKDVGPLVTLLTPGHHHHHHHHYDQYLLPSPGVHVETVEPLHAALAGELVTLIC